MFFTLCLLFSKTLFQNKRWKKTVGEPDNLCFTVPCQCGEQPCNRLLGAEVTVGSTQGASRCNEGHMNLHEVLQTWIHLIIISYRTLQTVRCHSCQWNLVIVYWCQVEIVQEKFGHGHPATAVTSPALRRQQHHKLCNKVEPVGKYRRQGERHLHVHSGPACRRLAPVWPLPWVGLSRSCLRQSSSDGWKSASSDGRRQWHRNGHRREWWCYFHYLCPYCVVLFL